jgi:hypothetical protein
MQVNYVSSAHGSPQVGPQHIEERSNLEGYVDVQNDVLLFEFDNSLPGHGATIVVSVIDPPSGSELARGELRWEKGEQSVKYVEFSDFPPDQAGAPMSRAFYRAFLFITSVAEFSPGVPMPSILGMTIYEG